MKVLILLSLLAFQVHASALSDAVAQMAEKSWRPLYTSNLLDAMLHSGPVSDVNYAFSNDGIWDPVSRQILYLGGPHGAPMIFNAYRESDNTWRQPSISGLGNHSWDGNAINPGRKELYIYQEGGIHRWNIETGSWVSSLSGLGETRYGSLEYFPELNGLVYVFAGKVHLYSYSSGSWSTIRTGLAMGGIHNVGTYSPQHKCLVFGGGTSSSDASLERRLYKMDADKTITPLGDAPFSFGVNEALMTLEPVTGNFIFCNNDNIYYYDLTNDSWTDLGQSFVTRHSRAAVVSIDTYGVICFLSDSQWPVLLYKYAEGGSAVQHRGRIVNQSIRLQAGPNPFRSAVKVSLGRSGTTAIYNVNGVRVANFDTAEFTWHAHGYPSGIYLLKAMIGNRMHTRQLILGK